MKILLAPLFLAVSLPAFAEVDSKIHKLCIEAKDYAGCVRSMKGETGSSDIIEAEKCWGSGLNRTCLAKEGLDQFGMPKIVDWLYQNKPSGMIDYVEADIEAIRETGKRVHKFVFIPHKGQKRYFGLRTVRRWRYNAQSGTPSTSTVIGSASTNCNAYGTSINCTSNPAPTIRIPGTPPRPGGIASQAGVTVYDCKDKTMGVYMNGKNLHKWVKSNLIPNCSDIPFDEYEVLNYNL